MPAALRQTCLGLLFLLEVAVLVAACVWAAGLPATLPVRVLAGAGSALLLAAAWGLLAAPRARRRLQGARYVGFAVAWFAVGAALLVLAGHPWWGGSLLVAYLLAAAALTRTGDYPTSGPAGSGH